MTGARKAAEGTRRRAGRLAPGGVLLALALAACGPMSPEVAAQRCEERARGATGPHGEIWMGVSTARKSPVVGGKASITSDYLAGRDPYQLYDSCVRQLSGQGPIRPLDLG